MPAIPSEFEEKEYEAPLYSQLENGTRRLWAPGQVFEQYIGIDRAAFLYDARLWRLFGVAHAPIGAVLNRLHWPWFPHGRPPRELPNFRLNLFIQAKRCYYYKRVPRRLNQQMHLTDCWRIDLDSQQQDVLEKVADRLGNRALVVYAAPAFHRISQLNAHTIRGTVPQHSTFPLASKLRGHQRWYYCSPGGSGVANPDPEQIDGVGLQEMVERLPRSDIGDREGTPSEQLAILGRELERTVKEDISDNNPRKAAYFDRLSRIEPVMRQYEESGNSERSFLRVAAFVLAFNLDWYAINERL